MTMRRGSQSPSTCKERSVEIRQEGMASPTNDIRQRDVVVQVGQGALGSTEVTLAGVHVLVGVIGQGKHTGLPRKGMATPEAGSRSRIGRRASTGQNLLHGVGVETLGNLGCLDAGENVRVVGGGLRRYGKLLLSRKLQ